jgi:DNA-binding transcriptional LysR family regulator
LNKKADGRLDFHQLEIFISIAKHKSFSKAAEAVFLTQPTLSTHINSLETELGTMLFNRGGKEVSLTPSGEVFFNYALELINLRSNGLANLQHYINKIEGLLEIGVSKTPLATVMPGKVRAYTDINRNVLFSLHEATSTGIVQRILDNEIELGIIEELHDSTKIESIRIFSNEIVALVPACLDLKERVAFTMKELLQMRLVLVGNKTELRKALEKRWAEKKLKVERSRIVVETDSYASIAAHVAAGIGCSLVPRGIASGFVTGSESTMKIVPLVESEALVYETYLVYHRRRTLSPLANNFREFISP